MTSHPSPPPAAEPTPQWPDWFVTELRKVASVWTKPGPLANPDLAEMLELAAATIGTQSNLIRGQNIRLLEIDQPPRSPEPAPPKRMADGVEKHYCGCVREAGWLRCVAHVELDHDDEPPRQKTVAPEPVPTTAPDFEMLRQHIDMYVPGPAKMQMHVGLDRIEHACPSSAPES